MILRTLRLQRFGRFLDGEWAFAPGLTVIRGPNEAGKSTMREAIVRLLLPDRKVDTSAGDFLALQTWGRDQRFVLDCTFDARGVTYELLRNFESQRVELRCAGTDEIITDESAVSERMWELLQVSSREVYETTACLAQQDFVRLQAGEKVAQLLQQTVVGAGGETGAQEVLDELESELRSLNRGLDRHAKNPGPIRASLDRIEQLDEEIARLTPITQNATEAADRIDRARERIDEIDEELAQANRVRDRAEQRHKLEEQLEAVSTKFRELDGRAREARELRERISQIDDRLEALPDITREQVEDLAKVIDAAELARERAPDTADKAQGAAEEAEAALKQVQAAEDYVPDEDMVRQVNELERDLADLREDLQAAEQVVAFAEDDLTSSRDAERGRRSWLVAAGVLAVAGAGLALGLGRVWPWLITAVGFVVGVLGSMRGPRIAVDEAERRHEEAAARVRDLRAETSATEEKLERLLTEAEVSDAEALSRRQREAREQVEKAREAHAAAKAVAKQATEQAERAQQQVQIADARLKHELEEQGVDSADEFLTTAREVFELHEERSGLRERLQGTLGDRELADIEAELSELSGDRMGLQERLDSEEMVFATLDPERFEELTSRIKALEAEREKLRRQIEGLQGAAGHPDADPERLRRLEEQRAAERKHLERVQERRDAYALAHELLTQAHEQTLEGAIDVLEPCTSELLERITSGRYCRVRFDRSSLEPSVHSNDKGCAVDPDSELSCATREQVYLAARLALTRLLWPDECPPIMLDDPFVNFDPTRREEAMRIVRDVSETHQVLLFTCHDLYDGAADRIVELPAP